MDTLFAFIGFGALFGGAWLLVRYIKSLQDSKDYRYHEGTDDGQIGGGGAGDFHS
jgi:hypothetical protein